MEGNSITMIKLMDGGIHPSITPHSKMECIMLMSGGLTLVSMRSNVRNSIPLLKAQMFLLGQILSLTRSICLIPKILQSIIPLVILFKAKSRRLEIESGISLNLKKLIPTSFSYLGTHCRLLF